MARRFYWLALALPGAAAATPQTVTHSGRVLDSTGTPLQGLQTVEFDLLGTAVPWNESHDVVFEDGYYAVVLGTSTLFDPGDFSGVVALQLTIDAAVIATQPLTSVPSALAVDGFVRPSASAPCIPAIEGALLWESDSLKVCSDGEYRAIATFGPGSSQGLAAQSCDAIHTASPGAPSGAYWIDPDGGDTSDAYYLWCDMVTDDGGWTLVMSIEEDNGGQPNGTGAYNHQLLGTASHPVGPAKIADADINLIGNEYRHTVDGPSTYNRWYLLSHPFANSTSQVTTSDQCKASYAAAWQNSTGTTSSVKGLGSTNDGCGPCADFCGGGGDTGSWWSWNGQFTSASGNGSFSKATAYANGWMYAR